MSYLIATWKGVRFDAPHTIVNGKVGIQHPDKTCPRCKKNAWNVIVRTGFCVPCVLDWFHEHIYFVDDHREKLVNRGFIMAARCYELQIPIVEWNNADNAVVKPKHYPNVKTMIEAEMLNE